MRNASAAMNRDSRLTTQINWLHHASFRSASTMIVCHQEGSAINHCHRVQTSIYTFVTRDFGKGAAVLFHGAPRKTVRDDTATNLPLRHFPSPRNILQPQDHLLGTGLCEACDETCFLAMGNGMVLKDKNRYFGLGGAPKVQSSNLCHLELFSF